MNRLSHYLIENQHDKRALNAAGNVSRADMVQAALSLSARLQSMQVKAAAFWFDDAVEFICALLACAHAGVEVYLPPNLLPDNVAWAEEHAAIWLSNLTADDLSVTRPLCKLPESQTLPAAKADVCRNIAIFLKTSASSGEAKVIRKTWTQMALEAQALSARFAAVNEHAVAIGTISPQHLYGLTFRIFLSLYGGWRIHGEQLPYPETLFAATAAYEHVVWITSPALLHRLHAGSPWQSVRSKVCAITSSGGPLSAQTAVLLREQQSLPLCEIYGSSESGIMAYRRDTPLWQWFDGVTHGNNDQGALWVNSAWTDGVQQTADAVCAHADGFELLGRQDRIIKLEDKRISLIHIEHALLAHEYVADAHIARRDGFTHLGAWLALSPEGIAMWRAHGRKHMIDVLKNLLKTQVDTLAVPRYWRFCAELPRNAQSKIAAADVQAAFAAFPEVPDWQQQADTENDETVFMGTVPVDLLYFGGHFATFPLVPGVIELRWVLDLARQADLLPAAAISRIENLKYQHFLRPNDTAYITLRFDAARGKLHFQCRNQHAVCASGRVAFDEA
ncbi:MAG: AMP-binding protein [Neisseria sp.]|nr:AMP-binding protein [Neisseria sp.]